MPKPTEAQKDEALEDAQAFKERHTELFERLGKGPDAESVVSRLTPENAVSEDMIERFVWVLQECAWAEGPPSERPDLPRVKDASRKKNLAYDLVMDAAVEQLRNETLARLVANYSIDRAREEQ
jgi:hypothetical protein